MDTKNGADKNLYLRQYELAANPDTREQFWAEQAKMVEWSRFPIKILDKSNPPFYRWFPDAELNTCYNCIDRHLPTLKDKVALIYESPITSTSKTYTWQELYENTSKFAGVLKNLGVVKGDRVIIYMPMIPEAVWAQLACARLGAIHSVVFGGFAAKELSSRIVDAKPKAIISASCGLEPGKVIDYKVILDDALSIAGVSDLPRIIVQRKQKICPMGPYDLDFYEELAKGQLTDPVPVKATDYLYILYTSGTTGQPKGIVRDNGGNAVAMCWTMKHIMGIGKGDVYMSTSDIGWVVGHSFITYGPLLVGATTVVFEGKPVGTPDPGVIWRAVEKYKANGVYTAPTALRALRREDPEGKWMKQSDLSSLRAVSMAGERCDIHTFKWLQDLLPKDCLFNDNYWQTETGWMISCNYRDLYTWPTKPGTATKPCPGYVIHMFDENNQEVKEQGKVGKLCIRLPMPPSFMPTLYNNDEAFIKKYLTDTPGYYTSGDAGFYDEDGYVNVVTRIDDIINTAGHRLSTSQMEEILLSHHEIAEAAVVGGKDDLRGEVPIGFIVLKVGINRVHSEIQAELVKKIREDIGAVAFFKTVIVVDKLPKTRSGKMLRNILRKMVDGEPYKVTPTIEDESVLAPIEAKVKQMGLGKKTILEFTSGQGEVDVEY